MLGADADETLDEKFANKKKQEDETLENLKEEYGFEKIKDAFDEGSLPNQLHFFYGGQNENFTHAVNFFHQAMTRENLLLF